MSIKRILIANRGEIAVRIMRTIADMELESVAIYSDADAQSWHRRLADFAVRLPGTTSAETYLNIPSVIDAAKRSGADAVHPGYGFLSESRAFADAVEESGLTFIGPTGLAIEQMGNKVEARDIMKRNGIPVVPGSEAPIQSHEDLRAIIQDVGYPFMLKAAAGGGGRGMRIVRQGDDAEAAFDACQREAISYFGNGDVFCERFVENPRHIEFQVLFDHHGHGVHLFERDCSVQRRHQKLFEEAPSNFLNEEQREKWGQIAVEAGRSVSYRGAGTVEFIMESPDSGYFMEMNTRIQVEHPVTEMITGIDLIREQIRLASGAPLGYGQEDIKLDGWAVEARINAEDPFADFRPAPGLITQLYLPAGPHVRVDTHIYSGYRVPKEYDSMIAKVITKGETRETALKRMSRALSEMIVDGIPTTVPYHDNLVHHPQFLSGEFNTQSSFPVEPIPVQEQEAALLAMEAAKGGRS